MPLIIGVTYLVASGVGGPTGGLWMPGVMVTFWGLADVLVLPGTWHVDFTSAAITGIGIGAVLSLGLTRFALPVNPAAIAVNLLLIGLLELAEAQIGAALTKGWPWALLLVAGALWELRPAVTFPNSWGRRAAGAPLLQRHPTGTNTPEHGETPRRRAHRPTKRYSTDRTSASGALRAGVAGTTPPPADVGQLA